MDIIGDPIRDNETRALSAVTALEAFGEETSQRYCISGLIKVEADRLDEIAGDLVCNILHLARANGRDPESILNKGRELFEEEEADAQSAES